MPTNMKAVILAAGLGTRMKSRVPKVLHPLFGKPMIEYILDAVRSSGVKDIVCVIGFGADSVRRSLGTAKAVIQEKQKGSGDALNCTKDTFKGFKGDLLVLCGDAPLVKADTLKKMMDIHRKENNPCTLLTAVMPDPSGYGRIKRDSSGSVTGIVEDIEASVREKGTREINAGTYCFKSTVLFSLLDELKNDNKKGEYFLTDMISLMRNKKLRIGSVSTDDGNEAIGINSRKDLSAAAKVMQQRTAERLMDSGVTIVDPVTAYIAKDVRIGKDTVIHPHTIIENDVTIGEGCSIGPFARIRPGCRLEDGVEVGNFVELVRTRIGKKTKVKHHTYLGDAVLGKEINIGAGTITANYDGKGKYRTKIDDGAFIGSGTILVAPVTIGKKAVTGAGAVVTKRHNVPAGAVVVGIPARELVKGARK